MNDNQRLEAMRRLSADLEATADRLEATADRLHATADRMATRIDHKLFSRPDFAQLDRICERAKKAGQWLL